MTEHENRGSPSAVDSLFADWLERCSHGAEPDFAALCRTHPEHSSALSQRLSSLIASFEVALGRSVAATLAEPADALATAPRPDRPASASPSSSIVDRLLEHRPPSRRYVEKCEIARGGMGAILEVWDESLRRSLAMKVILDAGAPASGGGAAPPTADSTLLARFLEEAQVTGQLDHPGVVPVHELGLDASGRAFFTMKLVKGRDLKSIFDLVFGGNDGWNETRALGVILKVCEAMAYAHSKGVIHRDLKPANVMVGGFGEVYVMDWGLARVSGRKDRNDIRLRVEGTCLTSVKTERREERESAPDSPLVTMNGVVVGTPAYMPPEQARGDIERLGPRSDVYSIGAMLYHLLARQMPFVPPGARLSPRTVLVAVVGGPPKALASIRSDVPAELVAIVEKAMERDSERRYASTIELGEDLRAFLERRVVKAYETGAVAELRKWVARNRGLAAAIAGAIVTLVVALLVVNGARKDAAASAIAAKRNEEKARAMAAEADSERQQVLRLADVRRLQDLEDEAARLWPAHPDKADAIADWIGRARALSGRVDDHRRRLADLRALALPPAEERLGLDDAASSDARGAWRFSSTEAEWQHAVMAGLVDGVDRLVRDDAGWSAVTVAALERRLEHARTVRRRTIDDARAKWDETIAGVTASDLYGGLALAPQIGLVPIGKDRESGLFEFWHVQSGDAPVRDAGGRITPTAEMGIVLVLIPGGTFEMGSPESEAPIGRYPNEGPRHAVTLDPYFISKYEMTQAQWQRFTGENPSSYKSGPAGRHTITPLHPVEQVSHTDCAQFLPRLGLDLPTEAQWERAARGGGDTAWWTGAERESLRGKANLADNAAKEAGVSWPAVADWPDLDDGHAVHAPIGSYPANPFGLHEVAGNVWEWCRDWFGDYDLPVRAGDGERLVAMPEFRVLRGGSFFGTAAYVRSALRYSNSPELRAIFLGVRPARRVEGE